MSTGAVTRAYGAAEREAVDPGALAILSHLSVAVQRHRIYPALSPLCREAVTACADAIAALVAEDASVDSDREGRPANGPVATAETERGTETGGPTASSRTSRRTGPLVGVRVGAGRLFIDSTPLPGSSAINDLTERLFRADVEELVITEEATETEIARFSRHVAGWERSRSEYESLAEALTVQGVTSISVRCTERLEVLDFDVLPMGQLETLRLERAARADADASEDREVEGPFAMPGPERDGEETDVTRAAKLSLQRAWVRVDTDCPADPIDMLDLAFLVDSQADLSQMLLGLAEGDPHSIGAPIALRETVSELVHLYSDLSEGVAHERFEQLASTFMELDPSTRRTLTRDVLMPDLLESGKAAHLLRLLPDSEIVEAIRTLTDMTVGGTGMAALAIRRLDLPAARLGSVTKVVRERAEGRPVGQAPGDRGSDASSPIRLESDHSVYRDMRDLAALELAVDRPVAERLRGLRQRVNATDTRTAHIRCVLQLLPLVRNPDRAAEVLDTIVDLLRSLVEDRPAEAAKVATVLVRIAESREMHDPEVTACIRTVLGGLIDSSYVLEQAERGREQGSADPEVVRLVEALGPLAALSYLEALEAASDRQVRRSVLDYMCGLADAFAPHLEPYLDDPRWTVVRNAVRVIGFAGGGREARLATLLGHSEKRVVREAFLALSRVGTPHAAEEILAQLEASEPRRRDLAEDAIRRFPAHEGEMLTRRLLSRPDLYLDRPQVATALIGRFLVQPSPSAVALLRPLLGLRFRFWQPSLCRLGWMAGAALKGTHQ